MDEKNTGLQKFGGWIFRGLPLATLLAVLLASLWLPASQFFNTTVSAHKDPPSNPQQRVTVTLDSAFIVDDSDPLGAGEIYVDVVVAEAGHPPSQSSRSPTVSADSGTRAVFGNIIYQHQECSPIQKLTVSSLSINDDDSPLPDTKLANLAAPTNLLVPGTHELGLAGGFSVRYTVFVENLANTSSCEGPRGGIAVPLDADDLPLETAHSSRSNAGLMAGIAAGVAAGAITLGGAGWYARRRWLR